ncbi:hypothetical protein BJY52DRAFT_1286352 [Lactarius psammicola]|nr:hypothetical protein BJY52DRAFT_1286352 [Lactarius psammicola]
MRLASTRRIYYVDHNTRTTTWDDPRLPSTVDADDASQYKPDYRRKIVYFRSQPAIRPITNAKCDVCINRAKGVNPEHLDYFKFIGHVLGLAVFHHWLLNA